MRVDDQGGGLWARFRSWPWWGQAAAWIVLGPLVLAAFTSSRPPEGRRGWWALTVVAALVWVALAAGAGDGGDAEVAADGELTTTTEPAPPTTRERQSSTTEPSASAPEGGSRSGDEDEVRDADGREDAVVRELDSNALLLTLASLDMRPEAANGSYDRDLFPQWDDEDGDGCDTRCEVLSSQRRSDGSWLSEWDGMTTDEPSDLHVDHVVALSEAWDSGADAWSASQRGEFADYLPNLLAVSAASNGAKADNDAGQWLPPRAESYCLWASTVVRVKAEWELSVDPSEAYVLSGLLQTCSDFVGPTTTTTSPPPTTVAPVPVAPPPPPPDSGCTPGYSPCIPAGTDVDCAGGGGNGPRYVSGPVQVDGSDPYDLDRDGDGVGCED